MRYAITFITSLIIIACSNNQTHLEIQLIAHAGGEIDGYTYTNSLEALMQSIENGYQFIEFDLALTADSVLVAVHEWQEFNEITGFSHKKDSVPYFNDFKQRLIHGKYTPLAATDINHYFSKDTTLYLVTDKISTPSIIKNYFGNLKQRMVIETFSYNDYVTLCKQGYFRVLYSQLAIDFYDTIKKHLLLHRMNKGLKIEWIASEPAIFNHGIYRLTALFSNFNVAFYTINDMNDISQKHINNLCRMIYTDKIKPNSKQQ